MKYTIKDFRKQFPNDRACLAYIFKQRNPDGGKCPNKNCGREDCFYPVTGRKCYACSFCGTQLHPTAGTIFHKSATPLSLWFYAIFLMSQAKNGVSAMELQRQLGVTYKTAWRMAKQIRSLMKDESGPFGGRVEVDETWTGGRRPGRGNKAGDHPMAMAVLKRKGGVKAKAIKRPTRKEILPVVKKEVKPGSEVMTDKSQVYRILPEMGYKHGAVDHGKGEHVRGQVHTNSLEGFWSQFKRSVNGTYHSVSEKHLQSYLDEFAFRYSHRDDVLPCVTFSRVGRHG